MNPRKKRLAVALWLAFLIWPAIQMALAFAYGVNPWKFAGWGMYSAPFEHPEITILEARDGQFIRSAETPLPPGAREKMAAFARRRFGLGRTETPEILAAWVLDEMPEWLGVGIGIKTISLDRRTGTLVSSAESYVYYRAPKDEPPANTRGAR